MFKLEAFDLADDGDCVTYFRRMMGILSKVSKQQGVSVDKLLSLYSKEEIEDIYPSLSPVMMQMLVEELTLMSYLEIKDSEAYITKKGEEKLKVFIQGLPTEDREALKL
jgi:ribosomal protein S19E (S16A)